MDLVKQLLSNLALLCALFAQCLVATIAPALVMCQESDGGQVLELVLADCCDAPAAPSRTEGPSTREQGPDCEGCTDTAAPLPLRRDDVPSPVFSVAFVSLHTPAWTWHACAPPRRLLLANQPPNRTLQALRTVNIRC